MLKKTITFTDFNGEERTQDHYFNLSKAELTEMQIAQRGGMEEYLHRVIGQNDVAKLMDVMKSFIQASYGVRSEDGASFIKSPENWQYFKGSGAYDALFLEMVQSETAMSDFVRGIIPAELREEAADRVSQADISVQEKYEQFKAQGMSDAEARSRAEAARSHLPAQPTVVPSQPAVPTQQPWNGPSEGNPSQYPQ